MIDTIKIEINLSEKVISRVKFFLQTVEKIDNFSGETLSSFCRGSLLGSWDSRISCTIKNQRFVTISHDEVNFRLSQKNRFGPDRVHEIKSSKKRVVAITVPEYLVIEFSLAKWATGINFVNSSLSQDALRLSIFRKWISGLIGHKFPPLNEWIVHRLDLGTNYFIGSDSLVERQLDCFRNLTYSRRKPIVYQTSIYFPGQTTTLKLYSKGPEFKAHDKKRFREINRDGLTDRLEFLAAGHLRYEIEFHSRKLDKIGVIYVTDIFKYEGWGDLMKTELKRLLAGATTTKIYTVNEVREKLKDGYVSGQGVSPEVVLSVWLTIALSGKKKAKESFGQRKVDRSLKILENLEIACTTNLHEAEPPKLPEFDFFTYDSAIYDLLIDKEICRLLPFDLSPVDKYYHLGDDFDDSSDSCIQ